MQSNDMSMLKSPSYLVGYAVFIPLFRGVGPVLRWFVLRFVPIDRLSLPPSVSFIRLPFTSALQACGWGKEAEGMMSSFMRVMNLPNNFVGPPS